MPSWPRKRPQSSHRGKLPTFIQWGTSKCCNSNLQQQLPLQVQQSQPKCSVLVHKLSRPKRSSMLHCRVIRCYNTCYTSLSPPRMAFPLDQASHGRLRYLLGILRCLPCMSIVRQTQKVIPTCSWCLLPFHRASESYELLTFF